MKMQTLLALAYPPQCIGCNHPVAEEFSLCGSCWRDTHFISGTVCDGCGAQLLGDDEAETALCDDCLTIARPWEQGRAVLKYKDKARRLVLALKNGDRQDLVRPVAKWMQKAAGPILKPDAICVPIPIHRTRLLARRFNQSALLASRFAKITGVQFCPDALLRIRRTPVQDGLGRDERFANVSGAIAPNPARSGVLKGRNIMLIDDVMTSGATFAAATEACHAAGAKHVCVLALARVAKDT
jgi:ComF family protein